MTSRDQANPNSVSGLRKPGLVTPEGEFQKLITNASTYIKDPESIAIIEKAYHYASSKHRGQSRSSGEDYITHPLAVANILTDLRVDLASLIAAVLHDVVEDTDTPISEIEEEFGPAVATLVDGLTKIAKIKFRSSQEKLAENFRKMVLAMAKDLRVILVKLADRLHNMRTLGSLAQEKRARIAQETLDIYAPLANRLGIYGIKSELEDLCLRETKYEVYKDLSQKVAAKKAERQAYIKDVKEIVEAELIKYGFKDPIVYGRPKHFFSIYKKMVDRQLMFEDIHDLFAFRIIVDSIKDCYEALGVVHAMWKPMPGRFKDYVAMPKANMYQSLHTTVIRPNGEPAEIQIRTREMHSVCEYGVAAHWAYKEKGSLDAKNEADLNRFTWLRQIMEWQSEIQDPDEFLEAVKVDLFDDEIFVFTPKGDVMQLPLGASALDFAFAVHTDIGLKTVGAKVNNRIAPLRTKLNSGDIIEIMTSPNQSPNKDWLGFVNTSKARNKIRSFLRSEHREQSKKIGQGLLEQELQRRSLNLDKMIRAGSIDALIKISRESKIDDLFIAIGYGKINAEQLIEKFLEGKISKSSLAEEIEKNEDLSTRQISYPKGGSGTSGVLVGGLDNCLVSFSRCCNPLPGEDIVGFVTRGRGVSIHRSSCPRALDLDPARRIHVEWCKIGAPQKIHTAFLHIVTQDRQGVLAEVTSTISSCGVGVKNANIRLAEDMLGNLDFELALCDLSQLHQVIARLEGIPGIISVARKNNDKNTGGQNQ